ncbi:MAG TPA: hypothetical protein VFK47_02980, partial [Ktedonobacteraceae bacterium]|nr:hypothetical protein [Ktedonobacteraceae bacterium]
MNYLRQLYDASQTSNTTDKKQKCSYELLVTLDTASQTFLTTSPILIASSKALCNISCIVLTVVGV